ncbi:MAG TPA: hypothetical protein VNN08_25340 [Thermoanaerobaculia bacterium]|nr:hypothetical protein [Thermoanaerobaculia bacterium]
MVYWQKFSADEFEYEFDEEELAGHGVTVGEVIELIWNGFDVSRNNRNRGGYQLVGRTDGGRRLKVIVYEKRPGLIRVITGWDL